MCNKNNCLYDHQCADCLYNDLKASRTRQKTNLDTRDVQSYKREYARIKRAEKLHAEMTAAGVL